MRQRPYTAIGISRVPCTRCGAPSRFQWNVCAMRGWYMPLCAPCDVALNEIGMRFVFGDSREAELTAYREKVLGG